MTEIRRRLFLVGSSRSGTTLCQACFARHPGVHTFPETHFFTAGVGRGWRRRLALAGLATGSERAGMRKVLRALDLPERPDLLPPRALTLAPAVRRYVALLDRLTQDAGAAVWLEKTPMHVHYLPLIERHVPDVRVLHIVRDGRDVVASLFERARDYPGAFGRQQGTAFGVRRWNEALRVSHAYLGRPGHSFLTYEELVEDPEAVLRRVCGEVGLPFDPAMLEDRPADGVIRDRQGWVQGAHRAPRKQASRFATLFPPDEQAAITRALDLPLYERIRRATRATPEPVVSSPS
jgi:hypothetical protein